MDLKEHIRNLGDFGYARPPGSANEKAAAGYLQEQFGILGLEVGKIQYPVLQAYSWFYALNYFLYLLAVMLFPARPIYAVFLTALATMFLRLDLYIWPTISRLLAFRGNSQTILGIKKAYEETRHTVLLTVSMDSRKGYYLSAGLRSWIIRLEYISGVLRSFQLLFLLAGSILARFSLVFWVRLTWMATWPGAILLWLLFYLELRRWLNGSWHSTVNDNDSSLALLLGVAETLKEQPFQHCDVVLAALGGDRDASLGMHNLLSGPYADWQKDVDIINLEAVGGGKLRLLSREGLSRPIPAQEELLDLGELIAENFETELLISEKATKRTSAAVARSKGFSAITLVGLDKDGLPCNFTQTRNRQEKFDLIEEERLQSVRNFVLKMIALIDHQL